MGWRERLPRTPAVFERKTMWAKHVGHEGDSCEWTGNYRSAAERPEVLENNFLAQESAQMMRRMTYAGWLPSAPWNRARASSA